MEAKTKVVLAAIGGYGENYLREIIENNEDGRIEISGAVDPQPQRCSRYELLKDMKVPVYDTLEEFYAEHHADLAVISSPIQYHAPQSIYALEQGSHVLCEKPLTGAVQEGYRMIEAEKRTGKILAIGYQWSFNEAILDLKRDFMAGTLGRAVRLKTLVLWPRTYTYYKRNNWAGRQKDSRGNWILDSVANNATAHYLHNMFFVSGTRLDGSAKPASVRGELYRANNIEDFDTAVIQVQTECGAEILYYGTHAVKEHFGPVFEFTFENAVVSCGPDTEGSIIAAFKDGTVKDYGNPNKDQFRKIHVLADAVEGRAEVPCRAETALAQTLTINGIHDSVGTITDFPRDIIMEDPELRKNERGCYVEGLGEVLKTCYEKATLPSEEEIPWARLGETVDLTGYRFFPGGKASD